MGGREVIVILWLVIQILPTLAIKLKDCKDYEYLRNGATRCDTCKPCPAGQMYTLHCGYEQSGNKITYKGPRCEPCPPNTYKSENSLGICRDCKFECPSNKHVVHGCNATHNLKCSQCKKGEYTEYNGSCMPCSLCHGAKIFNVKQDYIDHYVKQECVRAGAGMGKKSCRPLRVTTTLTPYAKLASSERVTTNAKKLTVKPTTAWVVRTTRRHSVTQQLTNPLSKTEKSSHRNPAATPSTTLVVNTKKRQSITQQVKTLVETEKSSRRKNWVITNARNPAASPTLVVNTTKRQSITQQVAKTLVGTEKPSHRKNWLVVDPGWLVAVAIGSILVSVIVFAMFKRFDIVKKIKVLLKPSSDKISYDGELMDEANEMTVVSVRERFECPPQQNITNYAELITNEDDNQSDSLTPEHHITTIYEAEPAGICSCQYIDEFSPVTNSEAVSGNQSELSSDDHEGPWVYRRQPDCNQPKNRSGLCHEQRWVAILQCCMESMWSWCVVEKVTGTASQRKQTQLAVLNKGLR